MAREVGQYNGRSATAWDDELRVGDKLSSPEAMRESILEDAVPRVSDDAEEIPADERVPVERPMERVTEADKKGDVKRLDRELERTLYLVVQGEKGTWEFPTASVSTDEGLHDVRPLSHAFPSQTRVLLLGETPANTKPQTARRALDDSAGVNMNTWIIGRVPVAHLVNKPVLAEDGTEAQRGVKSFFLKGRIMAGQADLKDNRYGLKDFKWLTREELKETLAPEYFHAMRKMMADR